MILRLRLSLTVLSAFALVVGAAALIGRSVHAPLAVVPITELRVDRLSYGVVDINRGLFSRVSLAVPGYWGSRFDADPALILQAVYHDRLTDWTLSWLDVSSGRLIPEMMLTTAAGVRLDFSNLRQHRTTDGIEFSAHVRRSGEVYRSGGEGSLGARLVTTVEPDLSVTWSPVQYVFWSPDWTQLVVSTNGSVTLMTVGTSAASSEANAAGMSADGGDSVTVEMPTRHRMMPHWSPDNRTIVFSPSSTTPTLNDQLPVVDAQTGEVVAELFGRGPNWCGDQIVYSQGDNTGQVEVRLADPVAGTDEVMLVRDLSNLLPRERTIEVLPPEPDSCDAFVIRVDNQYGLLRRETGTLIPLGILMPMWVNNERRIFDVVNGAVLVQGLTDDGVQIRRIALDPAVQRYDVLAEFDRLGTTHLWFDGWRRGLFIRNGKLTLIDAAHRTQIELTGPVVREFYVMQ